MTVLNTPSDGSFNVLIVLVRALIYLGPIESDELLAFCSVGPTDKPDRLRHTLNRWTELGLFQNVEGRIAFAEEFHVPKFGESEVRELTGLLRRTVFRPDNNDRFWDSEGSRSADLTRGLAWLLAIEWPQK